MLFQLTINYPESFLDAVLKIVKKRALQAGIESFPPMISGGRFVVIYWMRGWIWSRCRSWWVMRPLRRGRSMIDGVRRRNDGQCKYCRFNPHYINYDFNESKYSFNLKVNPKKSKNGSYFLAREETT